MIHRLASLPLCYQQTQTDSENERDWLTFYYDLVFESSTSLRSGPEVVGMLEGGGRGRDQRRGSLM